MIEAAVYMYSVQVTFDASTFTMTMGGEDFPISIPQGIAMISFELITINSPDPTVSASFNSNPIQWFSAADGVTPVAQPEVFLVQWFRPKHFSLVDFNSVLDSEQHHFNVVVTYAGTTYGSDPMIVNEPPAPVG